MRITRIVPLVLLAACGAPKQEAAAPAAAGDASCFGSRVLSFQDLVAEVVIPAGEACASGTFQVVFTRGEDTLQTLGETRDGTVGFIGTADVDGDGRGEFFVATASTAEDRRGALFAYTDAPSGITRLPLAALDSAQLAGYAGHDRFGFGGGDQIVRAFPRTGGDTAWFGYSHGEGKWAAIARPAWIR
ncbi:MAG: hypothetical protein K1X31_00870 [Gemmatimonadaceae bacterium]|nr:hypothetical protein [Gemmatimonadaceae bacterium]